MIHLSTVCLLLLMTAGQSGQAVDTTVAVQVEYTPAYHYRSTSGEVSSTGMMRVRQRINQIRGRGAPPAMMPFPVFVVIPAERDEDGQLSAPGIQLPSTAWEFQHGEREMLDRMTWQLNRRFDALDTRLDRMEELYYELVWRAGQFWRGDEVDPAIPFDPATPLAEEPMPDPATPLAEEPMPDPATPLAEEPMPDAEERLAVQPPSPRFPRAEIRREPEVRVVEVERALLETGLFRTVEVVFEFDRSDLLAGSERILDTIGDVLERHDLRLEIAGHTDNIGAASYNQRLSEARAETVRDYLLTHFDIDPEWLTTRGYGSTRPIFSDETPTGRTLNRRVEFVVVEE